MAQAAGPLFIGTDRDIRGVDHHHGAYRFERAVPNIRCGLGEQMQVSGVVANIRVSDIEAARDFYAEYLGLSVEGFNMGWVAHYQSPDGKAHFNL
jgi:hypothetical protein